MSALGSNLSTGESTLKAALIVEKSLRVPSCDFAATYKTKNSTQTFIDHYGNFQQKSIPIITNYLDSDLGMETNNNKGNLNLTPCNNQSVVEYLVTLKTV